MHCQPAAPNQSVAIVQSWLSPYRLPFYERLRLLLADERINLRVIYGQASPSESTKGPPVVLDWGEFVPNRYVRLGNNELSWQPALHRATRNTLVIVEQAVKRVVNWLLAAQHRNGGFSLAFWGHGRNFQSRTTASIAERAKRTMSREADWWFAYTQRSADVVAALPFDRSRITIVNNSIDTKELAEARGRAGKDPSVVFELRRRLSITGSHVGLFVGAMYRQKQLPFLVDCCDRIRGLVPDFEMVLVGAGPDQHHVKSAAESREWMHYVGPVFGTSLAKYFALASVVLMPGVVGLGVLDSFVCGTPMLTTDLPSHGPEMEYIVDGVNGLVVRPAHSVEAFSNAAAKLLCNEEDIAALAHGCLRSAASYSIEGMADNFAAGIVDALAAPRVRRGRLSL